jgi:hypothetical protein
LIATDGCEIYPRWETRNSAAPLMVDWFSAFPAPHDTD